MILSITKHRTVLRSPVVSVQHSLDLGTTLNPLSLLHPMNPTKSAILPRVLQGHATTFVRGLGLFLVFLVDKSFQHACISVQDRQRSTILSVVRVLIIEKKVANGSFVVQFPPIHCSPGRLV